MLLAVTNDLMAAAPIEHAARQLGQLCRVVTTSQLTGLTLDEPAEAVVLDLAAAADVSDMVDAIHSAAGPSTPIIAFGPHVHEQKLAAARQAGCTAVLTRGQFHRDIAGVLRSHLA